MYMFLKKCILLNHFAIYQKLTQHCKLTVLQFKKCLKKEFTF